MGKNKQIQRIATLPSLPSETTSKLLSLYNGILIKKDSIMNIIHVLCERICGIILRPELIETGKSSIHSHYRIWFISSRWKQVHSIQWTTTKIISKFVSCYLVIFSSDYTHFGGAKAIEACCEFIRFVVSNLGYYH